MAHHIETGAIEIANMMEKGQGEEVAERLRNDFHNMNPNDFSQLVEEIDKREVKGRNIDIEVTDKDKDGIPEITLVDQNSGTFLKNKEMVVGTRKENEKTATASTVGGKLEAADQEQKYVEHGNGKKK